MQNDIVTIKLGNNMLVSGNHHKMITLVQAKQHLIKTFLAVTTFLCYWR